MVKLDLHVHSYGSTDAITTADQISEKFTQGVVDQIAITDHNEIKYAQKIQDRFGSERIIVGEEVRTADDAELIGLFIHNFIPKGLPLIRTAELIKNQGGLVYVPHPFFHKYGVGDTRLRELHKRKLVDVVEVFNGWGAWSLANTKGSLKLNQQALELAIELNLPLAASTDSHVHDTLGNSYSSVSNVATRENLISLLPKTNTNLTTNYNHLSRELLKALWKRTKYQLQHR